MKWLDELKNWFWETQYGGFIEILSFYWKTYGGIRAVLFSPYFHVALAITYLMSGVWSTTGWWDHVLDVVPNMLGFSLGGYAIWLAIGDEKFKGILAGKDKDFPDESSPYMDLSVAFVHFIVIQFLALICALLALGFSSKWPFPAFDVCLDGWSITDKDLKVWASGAAFLLFSYSITAAVAATFQILRYSMWYDDFQSTQDDDQTDEPPKA